MRHFRRHLALCCLGPDSSFNFVAAPWLGGLRVKTSLLGTITSSPFFLSRLGPLQADFPQRAILAVLEQHPKLFVNGRYANREVPFSLGPTEH